MPSKMPDETKTKNLEKTELQVQQDIAYLNRQLDTQQMQMQNYNMQSTSAVAQSSATAQQYAGGSTAVNMIMELAKSALVVPAQQMAGAYSPFKKFDYSPYKAGFWPNIGGALGGDMEAMGNVEQSLAMLPTRGFQAGAFVSGASLLGPWGRTLSRTVKGMLGGSKMAGIAGGAAGFAGWLAPLYAASEITSSATDIGAFSQMAHSVGWKYRTRLTSNAISGVGFTPREAYGFGRGLYDLTSGSGAGFRGAAGEGFSKTEVEQAFGAVDNAGLLRDSKTVQGMISTVGELLSSYKSVAKELKITAESGMGVSTALMGMGFTTAPSIVGAARDVKFTAQLTGQSYEESIYQAMNMGQQYTTRGLDATSGFQYGLRSNQYLSSLYQTQTVPRMPESLGGYNTTMQMMNREQMSLMSNPQFQNAIALSSAGGEYSGSMMNQALGMHPNVLKYYARTARGWTPTQRYAQLWAKQDAESEALEDPTLTARIIAGELKRQRINTNDPSAVKGYLYNRSLKMGAPAGQARYYAEAQYGQLQNINLADDIQNAQLLEPYKVNTTFTGLFLTPEVVTGWNQAFGTMHRGFANVGGAFNLAGVNLAEQYRGWQESAFGIASTRMPVTNQLPYGKQSVGFINTLIPGNLVTGYDSAAMGLVKGYRDYTRQPVELSQRNRRALSDIYLDDSAMKEMSQIKNNMYNLEYESARANNAAERVNILYGVGGFTAGARAIGRLAGAASTMNPFVMAAAVKGSMGDIHSIMDPFLEYTREGYDANVYNVETLDRIDEFIKKNVPAAPPRYSKQWFALSEQITGMEWAPGDMERTRKQYTGNVTSAYRGVMSRERKFQRTAIDKTGRGVKAIRKKSKTGGATNDDILNLIGLYENSKKRGADPAFKERFDAAAKTIDDKGGNAGTILEAYKNNLVDNMSELKSEEKENYKSFFSTAAKGFVGSKDITETAGRKVKTTLGSMISGAGTDKGTALQIIMDNPKYSNLDAAEKNILSSLDLNASENELLERVLKGGLFTNKGAAWERFKERMQSGGGEVPAGTVVGYDQGTQALSVLIKKIDILVGDVDALHRRIQKNSGGGL